MARLDITLTLNPREFPRTYKMKPVNGENVVILAIIETLITRELSPKENVITTTTTELSGVQEA